MIRQLFCGITLCFLGLSLPVFGEQARFMRSKKENPNLLVVGMGVYDVLRYNHRYITELIQLEYKGPDFFGQELLKIRPFVALMMNFQASLWMGVGVDFEIFLGKSFVTTLGFGPGFFYQGRGKDLGYPLEIRSSVEFAYLFKSHARLGVQFYHLSNASLSTRRNPGTECLLLFYAIPL